MKRLLAVLAVVCLLVGLLCACTETDPYKDIGTAPPPATKTPSAAGTTEPATGQDPDAEEGALKNGGNHKDKSFGDYLPI